MIAVEVMMKYVRGRGEEEGRQGRTGWPEVHAPGQERISLSPHKRRGEGAGGKKEKKEFPVKGPLLVSLGKSKPSLAQPSPLQPKGEASKLSTEPSLLVRSTY